MSHKNEPTLIPPGRQCEKKKQFTTQATLLTEHHVYPPNRRPLIVRTPFLTLFRCTRTRILISTVRTCERVSSRPSFAFLSAVIHFSRTRPNATETPVFRPENRKNLPRSFHSPLSVVSTPVMYPIPSPPDRLPPTAR